MGWVWGVDLQYLPDGKQLTIDPIELDNAVDGYAESTCYRRAQVAGRNLIFNGRFHCPGGFGRAGVGNRGVNVTVTVVVWVGVMSRCDATGLFSPMPRKTA